MGRRSDNATRTDYGTLSVDAPDVTHTLGVFPEPIYAATGAFAFGRGKSYDVLTRELVGELGFDTTVYALNPEGSDFWAFDSSSNQLKHFAPTGWCGAPPSS